MAVARGGKLYATDDRYCIDNGAMIAYTVWNTPARAHHSISRPPQAPASTRHSAHRRFRWKLLPAQTAQGASGGLILNQNVWVSPRSFFCHSLFLCMLAGDPGVQGRGDDADGGNEMHAALQDRRRGRGLETSRREQDAALMRGP